MNSRPVALASAALALLLLAAAPARAATISINFDLVFDQIDLQGTGAIALADGWNPVMTQLNVTQSAVAPSTLAGSLGLDLDTLVSSLSVTGTFFLDLMFTDVDSNADFGGGLPSPFTIPASLLKPLVVTMDFGIDFDQLLAVAGYLEANPSATIQDAVDAYNATPAGMATPIMPTITDLGVERALPGPVDLDNSMVNDAVRYMGASLMAASVENTEFDWNIPALDLQAILDAINLNQDIALDIAGTMDVTVTDLQFTGGIFDLLADPDFSVPLSGPIVASSQQRVPEPLTAALLGLGLAGVAARRRLAARA